MTQHYEFTKPSSAIEEHSITLSDHQGSFINNVADESHQQKIATYARDSANHHIVAGILAEQIGQQLIIQGLWVSPPARNKRIGKTLLQLLEAYAEQQSLQSILLETTNATLLEFYRYNGYRLARQPDGECYTLQKLIEASELSASGA